MREARRIHATIVMGKQWVARDWLGQEKMCVSYNLTVYNFFRQTLKVFFLCFNEPDRD